MLSKSKYAFVYSCLNIFFIYTIIFIRGANMTIGEKLKKLRVDKKLKQKEIAIILNLSVSGYAGYESDRRIPGIEIIIKLANYYKVSTDYILGVDNKKSINNRKIQLQIKEIRKQLYTIEKHMEEFK